MSDITRDRVVDWLFAQDKKYGELCEELYETKQILLADKTRITELTEAALEMDAKLAAEKASHQETVEMLSARQKECAELIDQNEELNGRAEKAETELAAEKATRAGEIQCYEGRLERMRADLAEERGRFELLLKIARSITWKMDYPIICDGWTLDQWRVMIDEARARQ